MLSNGFDQFILPFIIFLSKVYRNYSNNILFYLFYLSIAQIKCSLSINMITVFDVV